MKLHKKQAAILLAIVVWISSFLAVHPVDAAISTSSSTILMDVDKTDAFINGQKIELEVPSSILADSKMYVPAKFLGDAMDFTVKWDDATRTIRMTPPGYEILMDPDHRKVTINGVDTPFETVAAIVRGKLLVKLTWVTDYMGASYTFDDALRRVTIGYTPHPASIYIEKDGNSRPVAKFTTAKLSYRIGEPVSYVDLSYDPDAEGLSYSWVGRQEAFFTPGEYQVSLQVTDQHRHTSERFTYQVIVRNEPYLTEAEYPFYMKPIGGFIQTSLGVPWSRFDELPALAKTVTQNSDRKLLVSSSPQDITDKGILYQDQVNGKARLYANHTNGTGRKMTFAILATNKTDKPVTIQSTHKGTVVSSVYENIVGDQTASDLLINKDYDEKIVVPPNKSLVYSQVPNLYPGEVTNNFYDITTDGELTVTFVADNELTQSTLTSLFVLPKTDQARGTFPVTEQSWNIQASSLDKVHIITIGDNKIDPFIKSTDATMKQEAVNTGNFGVVYKIHADKPRKMAVMVLARGGIFKGSFKVNGEIVSAPSTGVMTALDGMRVLARTTGKEDSLDIEFTPPVGSVLPIDLVFYPLDERK
ncbi:copper amine oxidase N-terminal domain-containing protein [Paenibacillus sp. GP183]|uniref:copper amine oxidase N-terminal domain-containing protein n=1 Tax=Paenibacillus sp. GP183 TaxID=1882751 RepID=UPI0008988DA5|nr:copper amine oxidase N-terminal domain-containing protein [Paenibacillus sp. GP183]SEC39798.1 Copper amine oxidase N-terminal domain-containing protein [Paenibacillus sp. GP183]